MPPEQVFLDANILFSAAYGRSSHVRLSQLDRALALDQRMDGHDEDGITEDERLGRKGKRHSPRQFQQVWATQAARTRKRHNHREVAPKVLGHYVASMTKKACSWALRTSSAAAKSD
ncbi:MAG TPA: hypothetical protein ENG33_02050 [Chloroflexi bacterium]|nr:hypothetical protein [Chloroflexota bacterium]